MRKILVAPSILSADFSYLARDIKKVERAGADLIHVDVMDGHFVPNITIGPAVVSSLKKRTDLPLDVHLMIKDPNFYLDAFMRAGSAIITVHAETCSLATIKVIKKKLKAAKIKFGISFNPATPVKKLEGLLEYADMILVMSVNPGFGGQAFMPVVVDKIKHLRRIFKKDIEVDGGITDETAPLVVAAGANILVAGSYIFKSKSKKRAIERLKKCAK